MQEKQVIPQYYECHITLYPQFEPAVYELVQKYKFKTSKIHGDQMLGDNLYMYLTGKDVSLYEMTRRMENVTDELKQMSIPYIRRKIEHIILDERYDNKN